MRIRAAATVPFMCALVIAAPLWAILTACTSGDGASTPEIAPQVGQPTTASVTLKESTLIFGNDTAISPSGQAVVTPVDGQWCLQDVSGVRCVDALAEASAAHGVVWRPNETAIAVTWGRQDPISIIDFAAGTSVETTLDRHRLLTFTPDGSALLGIDVDRPADLSRIDPVTLEPERFSGSIEGGVPQLKWGALGPVWGSSPSEPAVFTLLEGEEANFIEGGQGEQLLVSVTSDSRLALAFDDDIIHGDSTPDGTILTIFDRVESRSVGVALPPEIEQDAPSAAQLSNDGRSLLVIHDVEAGLALSSAAIDPETLEATAWRVLMSWDRDDPDQPSFFGEDGSMRWDGGASAWVLTQQGALMEITLS